MFFDPMHREMTHPYALFFALVVCCLNSNCDICLDQKSKFNTGDLSSFLEESSFNNESKHSIKMAWLGENTKKILVVTTEPVNSWFFSSSPSSDIYLSKDDGRNFTKITKSVGSAGSIFIQSDFGFFVNPHNGSHVILVGHINSGGTPDSLFISTDASETWTPVPLSFIPNGPLLFHPKVSHQNHLLMLDSSAVLYVSRDGGHTWSVVLEHVKEAAWSTHPHDPVGSMYVLQDESDQFKSIFNIFSDYIRKSTVLSRLVKSSDFGANWQTLQGNVYSLSMKAKFIYVSIVNSTTNERHLRVSTDGGVTFSRVQLPTITQDQFYSVVDVEEDLVFVHVDDPEAGAGRGTLYTSGSDGVYFSESLRNHLYMGEDGAGSDFYRVNSMRGTFITTRIRPDLTLQSLITFNRGAVWRPLRRPVDAECMDPSKPCELQISNGYSRGANVLSQPPLSVASAPGVLLAHGHVAANLKKTPPHVFVSRDGGYNWKRVLEGPHHYQIADQGGLLVAVPVDTESPSVVKFSTDQGECWHHVNFTTRQDALSHLQFHFTGIFTEPGNRAMTAALWGYAMRDKRWMVHLLDFAKLISRQCGVGDWEIWQPHQEMGHPAGDQYSGCLLGVKEIYRRVKSGTICANGNTKEEESPLKVPSCPCTKEDYECEYGYYRAENSTECVRSPLVSELDVCVNGNEAVILSQGYRKIPGDMCQGGDFKPDKRSQKMLQKKCNQDDNMFAVEKNEEDAAKTTRVVPSISPPKTNPDDVTLSPNKKVVPSSGTVGPGGMVVPGVSPRPVVFLVVATVVLATALLLALAFIAHRLRRHTRPDGTSGVLHYHLVDERPPDYPNGHSVGSHSTLAVEEDAPLVVDGNLELNLGAAMANERDVVLLDNHQHTDHREEDAALLDDDEAALLP